MRNIMPEIKAVTMFGPAAILEAIQNLPYVAATALDVEVSTIPIEAVEVQDFLNGSSTWNLDAINVTDYSVGRVISYTGQGVYVAVLDTGLVLSWRQYFPQERIATDYARSFGGGGALGANISEQPDKWEKDTDSHGKYVTSTIIGYSMFGNPVNGVAPLAKIIPVKVINQGGSGWSSVIAYGILYVAGLKDGPLADSPVVINMSLGGPSPDPILEAAIDYAIAKGVVIVAAAGNSGAAGMDFPGGYPQVISAGAYGSIYHLTAPNWIFSLNIPDPTNADDYFIGTFSSRALAGQDLDVVAPGVQILGPLQDNQGHMSYWAVGGTSMASPHVAGTVALMAQKYPALEQSQAESILENKALTIPPGCRWVISLVSGAPVNVCWGADATGHGLLMTDKAVAATP